MTVVAAGAAPSLGGVAEIVLDGARGALVVTGDLTVLVVLAEIISGVLSASLFDPDAGMWGVEALFLLWVLL